MAYKITKRDLSKYAEIRGKIIRKAHFLNKYAFVIADGEKTVKIYVGKELFHFPMYDLGAELTVGYSGHSSISVPES